MAGEAVRGHLLKRGVGMAVRWKRRWFALEGDRLYYYVSESAREPINYVDLNQVHAIPAAKPGKSGKPVSEKLSFELSTLAGRVYKLRAETPADRTRWIAAINSALASQQAAERDRIKARASQQQLSLRPVQTSTLRVKKKKLVSFEFNFFF